MKSRKLGNIGTEVSALGYGAMSLIDFYGPINTESSHAILKRCLDLGVDHLDTSNVYGGGVSEERIGSFLAAQGTARNDLFKIATKGGINRGEDGSMFFDNSAEHLTQELDKSLKRLSVDQVELYYVHRRDQSIPIEEVTETLARFVKAGKIKQFGYSEIAPSSLQRAANIHPVGAVQSEYSLSTRSPELGLVQRCAELNTTLVAFSPVGRSLLTDTPHSFEKAQTIAFLQQNPRFLQPNLDANIKITDGLRALAADMGCATASLAIAWLLNQGDHIIPIPGTRSIEHLNQLAAGVDLTLRESDLAEIERRLPIGWAHGDRYTAGQWGGPEKYC